MHSAYKKWILNSYDKIHSDYVDLDKLDQLVGDGDHGSTILKGMKVAKDLFLNPEIITLAKTEYTNTVGEDFEYYPLLGERKPPLDYRK